MLAKTIYGVEYNPKPIDDDSNGLGWIIAAVIVILLVSLTWTLLSRYLASEEKEETASRLEATACETSPSKDGEKNKPAVIEEKRQDPAPVRVKDAAKRPQKVRILLQRLEEARKKGDAELEVSTMEQLRSLPGAPAADLDDPLARRLGTLNVKRLFEKKSRLWVKEVEVRPGQSASRIAAENGSTLASFARLNGGNVDKIYVGKKMYVLDHPRFQLVVHRRLKLADLMLNGKFFKRYDLLNAEKAKEGAYEIPQAVRPFWTALGIELKTNDRTELEILLPKGSPVVVSEL